MSDFYRDQCEHWFNDACCQARLIGGITAWVEAAQSKKPIDKAITPAKAITEIRRLLNEFKTETKRDEAVTAT